MVLGLSKCHSGQGTILADPVITVIIARLTGQPDIRYAAIEAKIRVLRKVCIHFEKIVGSFVEH